MDIDNILNEYLDRKIQLFQSECCPDFCLKCEPSAPYQFFSEDAESLTKFSSSWFHPDQLEDGVVYTLKVERKFKWCPDEVSNFTDIGFCDKLPHFDIYKSSVSPIDKDNNKPKAIAASLPLGDRRFIQITPKLEHLSSHLEKNKKLGSTTSTEKTFEIPPRRANEAFLSCIKLNSRFKKNIRNRSDKFDVATKLATSRFGRTRAVIDFRVLNNDSTE